MFELLEHQKKALDETKDRNLVAYYLDMGLGKTFVGSEKAVSLKDTILIISPKAMIESWKTHFNTYYKYLTQCDLRKAYKKADVYFITYDLVWRREINIEDYTLMLDESSYIQNETSKRTKAILKLKPKNVILLSGTPTSGRYEKLYSQVKLLGWNIKKSAFWDQYVVYKMMDYGVGFKIPKVIGYKNIEELKKQLRDHGCVFMKTEDVLSLPETIEIPIECKSTKAYKTFMKESYIEIGEEAFIGDSSLKKLLYSRELSSIYCEDKIEKLKDLIESTEDRLIIFYNFKQERELLKKMIKRPLSEVNGEMKDLEAYENEADSITLIQYQAGSMGLNLQKANKIIYFSPTLSAEMFSQSKKRIHRIGQKKTCFYYYLISGIESHIYETLEKRVDYTWKLFEEERF